MNWMRHVDKVLEDPPLLKVDYDALASRWTNSLTRGRKGTPVDVAIRLLVWTRRHPVDLCVPCSLRLSVLRAAPWSQVGGSPVLGGHVVPHLSQLGVLIFAPESSQETARQLEAPRQPEDVLGHVGIDQVGRDRRHLVEPGLAELAFDVVFVGETEAAVGLHADIGGFP